MEQEGAGIEMEDADMYEDIEVGGLLRKGGGKSGRHFPKFAYDRDFGDLLDNSVFDAKWERVWEIESLMWEATQRWCEKERATKVLINLRVKDR